MSALTLYTMIADFTAILHGFVVAFWLFIFFSWTLKGKIPVWLNISYIISVTIGFFGIIFLRNCPLSVMERYFRGLSGQGIYNGSFIIHYFQK